MKTLFNRNDGEVIDFACTQTKRDFIERYCKQTSEKILSICYEEIRKKHKDKVIQPKSIGGFNPPIKDKRIVELIKEGLTDIEIKKSMAEYELDVPYIKKVRKQEEKKNKKKNG